MEVNNVNDLPVATNDSFLTSEDLDAVVAAALMVYITAKVPRSVRTADKVGLFLLRALFFGSLLMLPEMVFSEEAPT